MALKTQPSRSILVINPNSTKSMTNGLQPLVEALGFGDTKYTFFTAPSGPPSINNEEDAAESATHCLVHLEPLIKSHDAFLVCCYSQHPLVPILKFQPDIVEASKPVTGIFEASVATALQVIHPDESFGIVSTGKVWETLLTDAVKDFIGLNDQTGGHRFAGVETTGLNATELHDTPAPEVRKRMKEAVKRLIRSSGDGKRPVGAVCLGCAGMAGMDEMVREASVEELGPDKGRKIKIIDGVAAGVAWLEGILRLPV